MMREKTFTPAPTWKSKRRVRCCRVRPRVLLRRSTGTPPPENLIRRTASPTRGSGGGLCRIFPVNSRWRSRTRRRVVPVSLRRSVHSDATCEAQIELKSTRRSDSSRMELPNSGWAPPGWKRTATKSLGRDGLTTTGAVIVPTTKAAVEGDGAARSKMMSTAPSGSTRLSSPGCPTRVQRQSTKGFNVSEGSCSRYAPLTPVPGSRRDTSFERGDRPPRGEFPFPSPGGRVHGIRRDGRTSPRADAPASAADTAPA